MTNNNFELKLDGMNIIREMNEKREREKRAIAYSRSCRRRNKRKSNAITKAKAKLEEILNEEYIFLNVEMPLKNVFKIILGAGYGLLVLWSWAILSYIFFG